MRSHTYTLATLEVSEATFKEIWERLSLAGYDYTLNVDAKGRMSIDMTGLMLKEPQP